MNARTWFAVFSMGLAIVASFQPYLGQTSDQAPPGNGLALRLEATKQQFKQGEQIVLKITFENPSGEWVVIYPNVTPEKYQAMVQPKSEVLLKIHSTTSQSVSFTGGMPCINPPVAHPEDFLILRPRHFYGFQFQLKDSVFAYDIREPGTYFVRAVYTSNAKEWLERYFKKYPREKKYLYYSLTSVFAGSLESNEIQIEVVGAAK